MPVTVTDETLVPEQARQNRRRGFAVSRELGLILLIVAATIVSSILFPESFPTFENFSAIMRNLAFDGILAVGMSLLLVGGLFDLSIGGMFSMTGVIVGWMLKTAGLPVPIAILIGLAAAVFGGFLNGFIVAKIRVNALITTLGTMQIYRGIAILVGGSGITFLPNSFTMLGQASLLGMQAPVWLLAFLVAVFHYLLTKTRFFRQYYYIGGNAKAAQLCGINVPRMQVLAFMIMGLLAGIAGTVFAARLATGVSIAGDGAELRVITAVILGGASLTGGKGTVWGALIGVVFIAMVNNIMLIAQISTYWQSIVTGTVLVLAVAMDHFFNRGR